MSQRVALLLCLSFSLPDQGSPALPPAKIDLIVHSFGLKPEDDIVLIIEKSDGTIWKEENLKGKRPILEIPRSLSDSLIFKARRNTTETFVPLDVNYSGGNQIELSVTTAAPTWNMWSDFDDAANNDQDVTVNFDLAGIRYDLPGAISVLADDPLQDFLETDRASKKLLITPFLQGEGITLRDNNQVPIEAEVDIKKIYQPISSPSPPITNNDQASDLFGALSTGRIKIAIHASATANAAVSLAIFDANRMQILDVISYPISRLISGAPTGTTTTSLAGGAQSSRPIKSNSGLSSLLSSAGSRDADAALGIFEFANEQRPNTVVFIMRKSKGTEAYTWNPRRSIRHFVGDDGSNFFGLSQQLQFIHCPPMASSACIEDFTRVATSFSKILFSDPQGKINANPAEKARRELEQLLSQSNPKPKLSTLFIDSSGRRRPIPLGLLGFDLTTSSVLPNQTQATPESPSEKRWSIRNILRTQRKATLTPPAPVDYSSPLPTPRVSSNSESSSFVLLGERAEIIQPLPESRQPLPNPTCLKPENFKVFIPTDLSFGTNRCARRVTNELLKATLSLTLPKPKAFKDLFTEFSIESSATSKKSSSPENEGILVLAHHANGFLSSNPKFNDAIVAEDISRRYAPGSIAVLIGCSVGSLSSANQGLSLVSQLNQAGIDAMVFSPFSVNAQLGSRFAFHFSKTVQDLEKNTSLAEVFNLAVKATKSDKTVDVFAKELYEFLLLGNGDLEFCQADRPGTPSPAEIKPRFWENWSRWWCDRFLNPGGGTDTGGSGGGTKADGIGPWLEYYRQSP